MRWYGFLAITLVMAGCVGGGGISDDGRTVIAEDQYYNLSFEARSYIDLNIEVEVHSGPNIDVLVVDNLNFNQFQSGNSFIHYESCGGVAAQGFSRSCSLDEGAYTVVLDNTDAGRTKPPTNAINDEVDVSWRISAS